MIAKNAIEPAPLPSLGFYSLMFVVPKVTGGWRPVIDLSTLNGFVAKTKFRMETPATTLRFLRPGDWLFSVDLKDAYFQIPIHPASRPLLRFVWQGRAWQFRALCFGLSTAPQVFTRVMAVVSVRAHERGIRLVRYIDDWLIASEDHDTLLQHRAWLLQLCEDLGILVNMEKSELTPTRSITYLGMDLDTVNALVRPSQKRLSRLADCLQRFRSRAPAPPAIEWLRLLGHMASVEKFTAEGRGRMRSLLFCLSDSWSRESSRFEPVAITPPVLRDLLWWEDPRSLTSGVPFHEPVPEALLFTDASNIGWGAHLQDFQASGLWDRSESLLHINHKELVAVQRGLQAFLAHLEGLCVQVHSDNSTVVSYIAKQGGTHSRSLCDRTLDLLRWARQHRITLSARFLPGSRNVIADQLSRRGQDIGSEWTLHSDLCQMVWRLWGRPHIDMFATRLTTRLPTYVSALPDPEAWATDAFSVPWNRLWIYAFPPFALLRRVINRIRAAQHLEVILIAPWWPAREWFPDLLELCVDHPRKLPEWSKLLKQPRVNRFHSAVGSLNLHAWRLSSLASDAKGFRAKLREGLAVASGDPPPSTMTPSGESLSAGWCDKALIAAKSLSQ